MALKVKAKEKLLKFSKQGEGSWRYVMVPDLYSSLAQDKVIREAALRSGVSQGVMQACWDAAGQVIKAWATEGHSVALPGLGTMRFGLSASAVENVNDVKSGLIKTRRIIFTPSTDLKDELKNTAIIITCYDRNGNEVKRVTSTDDGTVENNEDNGDDNGVDNGSSNSGSSNGGSTSGNTNTGSGSQNSGSGSNTGGNTNSGSNTGGNTSGNQNGSGDSGEPGNYRLVIYKYGSGISTVTDDSEQEFANDSSVASGSTVNISVVPAAGKIPTAKYNGSNTIALTENDGVYTGSFQMPTRSTVLEINSEPSEYDFGDGD